MITRELLFFVTGEHRVSDLPSWIPDFCTVPWYPGDNYITHWYERGLKNPDTNFRIEGRDCIYQALSWTA